LPHQRGSDATVPDPAGTPIKRSRSRQQAGAAAEERAAQLLEEHGLRVVARNFRTRFGEVDLIARDGDTLVFVEVRLRARADYGGAAASITRTKQRRIIAAARLYLRRAPASACRFDAVLLCADDIEWIPGAFME